MAILSQKRRHVTLKNHHALKIHMLKFEQVAFVIGTIRQKAFENTVQCFVYGISGKYEKLKTSLLKNYLQGFVYGISLQCEHWITNTGLQGFMDAF